MKMPPDRVTSLRDKLGNAADWAGRFLWGATASVALSDLVRGTSLGGRLGELCGPSVLIATADQLSAALALIELDGLASRLIIGTPDLSSEHLPALIAKGGVDAIVSDQENGGDFGARLQVTGGPAVTQTARAHVGSHATEWVLLTSGTTGVPKMLVHRLASLTAPIKSGQHPESDVVWATFYDIRRYGGLQIFLRALLGRGSFVLSSAAESAGDYLCRLGSHRVTHISGTPSHWRRAPMNPAGHAISPRYVPLSGAVPDQPV